MIHRLAIIALAAALLPASADAAKLRFGGGSRSGAAHAAAGHRDGHVVVTPSLRSRQETRAATNQPARILTPIATTAAADATQSAELRGAQPAEPRIWCRSQTVIGGFCVMN